jgi:AcrR family transcriptional regulator/DNA-binding MarR family transcriptional regulator
MTIVAGDRDCVDVLAPGERGASTAQLAELQRARLLAATFDAVAEQGAANVTVARVIARARVSRRTFYECFRDSEDCFLAALDEALGHIAERVLPAWRGNGGWQQRMRAALIELLALLDEQPTLGRLLIAESLSAGPRAAERRDRAIAQAIAAVEEGRGEDGPPDEAARLIAEGVVGGVLSVIHTRLLAPKRTKFVELANPLMYAIALPYLGAAAARRELDRPLPDCAGRLHDADLPARDPLRGTRIRLTYRTVSVLRAIGEQPGASNRQIGTRAGVSDQGQMSKLLARLERLGLVVKDRVAKGGANAWSLTEAGDTVARSLRAHMRSEARCEPRIGVRTGEGLR